MLSEDNAKNYATLLIGICCSLQGLFQVFVMCDFFRGKEAWIIYEIHTFTLLILEIATIVLSLVSCFSGIKSEQKGKEDKIPKEKEQGKETTNNVDGSSI
ncbi:MAG: hypothetical protein MHMPM18_000693 [Marteilia pararefringens]